MADDLKALLVELRQRQGRLGTPAEEPDDFERTLALAHEVSNLITALWLREAVEQGGDDSTTKRRVRERYLK